MNPTKSIALNTISCMRAVTYMSITAIHLKNGSILYAVGMITFDHIEGIITFIQFK